MNAFRCIKSKIKAEMLSVFVTLLEICYRAYGCIWIDITTPVDTSFWLETLSFATAKSQIWLMTRQWHASVLCRSALLFLDLCCLTCKSAAWANWTCQSAKWLVISLTDKFTNWFGMGSVDFQSNLASSRVLELPREQSRWDNNFSSCRSNLVAQ